jgi:hypothetical protein
VNDNTTSSYPDELGCNQFGLESDGMYLMPISNSSSCSDSHSSSGGGTLFDDVNDIFHDNDGHLSFKFAAQNKLTYSNADWYCSNLGYSLPNSSQLQKYSYGPGSYNSQIYSLLSSNTLYEYSTSSEKFLRTTDSSYSSDSGYSGDSQHKVFNYQTQELNSVSDYNSYFALCVKHDPSFSYSGDSGYSGY